MEFKGAITELPTNLNVNNNGHFYKVAQEFTLPTGITKEINETIEAGWHSNVGLIVTIDLKDSNIPSTGYCHLDYTGDLKIQSINLYTSYDDIDG